MNEQRKKDSCGLEINSKHQILNEMNSETCSLNCEFTGRFAFYFQKGCLHLVFFSLSKSHYIPSLHLL